MKKILFSCLMALGIGVNAQLDFTQGFEDSDTPGAIQFGGGSYSSTVFCNGAASGALAISATTTQTGFLQQLLDAGDFYGQTNNGQSMQVSFNYRKTANLTGTVYVGYAMYNESSDNWTITTLGSGTTLSATAITTCANISATIPTGTFDPNKTYAVGSWFIKSGSGTGSIYVDDIKVLQNTVTTTPACAAFTSPVNGGTISSGTVSLTWNVVPNATQYKIAIGTTAGSSNVVNTTAVGSASSTNVSLAPNTTYYARITATNSVGDATGCQEITFSTNSNVAHCGPLTSSAPNAIAPIKSVNFAGVTNTSDPSATTIGSFPVHQNFTTTEFIVKDDVTSVPLTILGTTNGNAANGWAMAVFIDWNNDGDFNDVGESYFNTTATMIRKAGVTDNPISLNGNITIPAGTSLGKKFMRIKYNFSGTTLNTPLTTGCENMINGQVEDYTIDYQSALAVSDLNKKAVSVYPNPFTDVLNISDVKGVKSISVNDISGREVKSLAPAAELNLSNLKTGLYIVNLKMEDGSVKTFKAIKK